MSEKPTRLIIDCSTGEQSIVELTDEEITQREKDRQAAESRRLQVQAAEEDRLTKKNAAIQKLKALGLTEEEVTALL